MKRITIRTNSREFYLDFLTVMKSRDPISRLRPKEIAVLSEILFQNAQLVSLSDDDRYDILFSPRKRKEIRDLIGLSEDSFNNNLSALRKWGLITKGNRLNKSLETVVFDDGFKLEFLFKDKG